MTDGQSSSLKEECRYRISDLCAELKVYLLEAEIQEIYRAYLYGERMHEGQKRMSGEPYIFHPLAVARILSEMRMDSRCLIAALLHDVIEDTPAVKKEVAEQFGEEVAELVDGVSKLTHLKFDSRADAQAASFRKMLLAMSKDIRVILIKLADRLHNMRTLGAMPPEKRRRIARETLDIYAPIASRLGTNDVRLELEDLSFAACWPMRSRVLEASVLSYRGNRREQIENTREALAGRLKEWGITARIEGREKHIYGIYRKMIGKHLSFSEVMDMQAYRIIVERPDTCYLALGAVHNYFRPVMGRFKDYIAIPKANGYQSLHTILKVPSGLPMEIQIRTEKMHQVAEAGVAAHWKYKDEGGQAANARNSVSNWVKDLVDLQQDAGNSIEFLEHVKMDLFPDEVYVFTPNNEIKVLAKGATVIDFAYAVHSAVGHGCVAARIDHKMVPLRTRLSSGQTVEVIANRKDPRPNPAWLNFAVTARARAAIRAFLKNLRRADALRFGRQMVEQELERLGTSLEKVGEERVKELAEHWKHGEPEQLFVEVGLGSRAPLLAARFLVGSEGADGEIDTQSSTVGAPLILTGGEGVVVKYARCCFPIPGDAILAGFSSGKGIMVHRRECRNIADPSKQGEHWLEVGWSSETEGEFSSELSIEVEDTRGTLALVSSVIAEMGSNIESISVESQSGPSTLMRIQLAVTGRQQLAAIIKGVRRRAPVLRVYRVLG